MSLGGITAICLAAQHPDLVRRLAIVDVTPGVDHAKAEPIVAFVSGPETFASFQEILDRTVEFNPTRSVSSLRRGILHNAKENPDGSWTWRWDPMREWNFPEGEVPDFGSPLGQGRPDRLPRSCSCGAAPPGRVVGDEDEAELLRRQPDARVVTVDGAGHSLQGDQPLETARLPRGCSRPDGDQGERLADLRRRVPGRLQRRGATPRQASKMKVVQAEPELGRITLSVDACRWPRGARTSSSSWLRPHRGRSRSRSSRSSSSASSTGAGMRRT